MEKKNTKRTLKRIVVKESWFWARALYKAEHGGKAGRNRKRHLWERCVFLFRAARGSERLVARRVAKSKETRYKNHLGETISWRLKEIEAFSEVMDARIVNGTEVYWEFFQKDDRPKR